MILGVSADAEMSTINQVAKRSLMELRLGSEEDPAGVRLVEKALETLQDPVERFHWGFFWPELTVAEAGRFCTDPVLSTLADDQCQDAAAAYELIADRESIHVWSHNVGVLALLHAVAATEAAQVGTPDDIEDDLECVHIWQHAFQYLKIAIESDEFWMRQKLRAKALGDARLDSARVEEIRNGLLAEILAPTGSVITIALLDGHSKVASVYVDLLRTSEFDEKFIEKTLSSVYKPLADRVERHVKLLEEKLEELEKQPSFERDYQKLLDTFKVKVMHDLNVMIEVGDLPGYAEEHARDTAAEFLRSLSIASWNKTEKATVSKPAIRLALRFADAESLKSKVKEDFSDFKRLELERDSYEKIIPLRESFTEALEQGNFREAISLIDRMSALTKSADDRAALSIMRKRVSSAFATVLFNKAVGKANARDLDGARRLLDEALKYEKNPSERIIIQSTLSKLSQLSQQGTGCLSSFLLISSVAAMICFVVGVMIYVNIK